MYFSFQDCKTKQVVEVEFEIGKAPKWGSVIVRGKRRLKRIIDRPADPMIGMSYQFRADSLPRNHPDAPRLDSKGRPVFLSKREVKEFVAKHNHKATKSQQYEFGVD
jgi:hypothetical protein